MYTNCQLVKCYCSDDLSWRCQDACGKCKSVSKIKGQCVKLKKQMNRINYDSGHSQMQTENFSRRSSGATIISTLCSTNTTPQNNTTKYSNQTKTQTLSSLQPQKSWSLPHIESDKKTNNCQFTEQRSNYERMTTQRQQPWSSEQVVRCNISNSRIPTYLIEHNSRIANDGDDHDNDNSATKLSDAINAKFMALREFRKQNSRDCFGDCRYRDLELTRAPTPQYGIVISDKSSAGSSDHQTYTLNGCTGKNCKTLKDNANLSKSSTMPYAARQRLLRERLAKELPKNANTQLTFKNMGLNKSLALSYQSMY